MNISHYRHARMNSDSVVLLSHGADSIATNAVDMSATGMSVVKPTRWTGQIGQIWAMDLLVDSAEHIHLDATVVRLLDNRICFAYVRIPEDRQVPLWDVLGGYADRLEAWGVDNEMCWGELAVG